MTVNELSREILETFTNYYSEVDVNVLAEMIRIHLPREQEQCRTCPIVLQTKEQKIRELEHYCANHLCSECPLDKFRFCKTKRFLEGSEIDINLLYKAVFMKGI